MKTTPVFQNTCALLGDNIHVHVLHFKFVFPPCSLKPAQHKSKEQGFHIITYVHEYSYKMFGT